MTHKWPRSVTRVAWTIFVACSLPALGSGDEIQILASRSGYNLIWPTTRCCAFEVRIVGDGTAKLTVKRNSGKEPGTESRAFRLTADELLNIRRLVDENNFFSLPQEICCGPVDGDEHRLSIQIGTRSNQVHFGEGALDKQESELARALNVWRGLKATFKILGENVEQANAF